MTAFQTAAFSVMDAPRMLNAALILAWLSYVWWVRKKANRYWTAKDFPVLSSLRLSSALRARISKTTQLVVNL
jgi:hypothetical protein